MKIRIIGNSGSGKTYLAKQLAEKYQIPHYDLDDIFWDNSIEAYGNKREPNARDKMLSEILKKENWIIEGVYYSWCEATFAEADEIYLLEVSSYVYKWRIIKRYFLRKLGVEKEKDSSLKSLMSLLKWTKKFEQVNMVEIQKILDGYPEKVIREK